MRKGTFAQTPHGTLQVRSYNFFLLSQKIKVYLKDGFLATHKLSKITIRNIAIYWEFENISQTSLEVTLTGPGGVRTVVQFGVGYWTFNMISEQLATEGITLIKNKHNKTCRIFHATHSISLGEFGILLGFVKNTTVPGGTYKDSGRVNVMEGVTIEQELRDIYYDPKTGYQSEENIYQQARSAGLRVSRQQIKEWLQTQDTYTKHKPLRKRGYKFQKTYVKELADQLQMDLVDMGKYRHKNKGYDWSVKQIRFCDSHSPKKHRKHDKSGERTLSPT